VNEKEREKKKAEIKISGMSCATCALNIEKALKNTDGVSDADVNFGSEKAYVEYDPEKVDISALEGAVQSSGYSVLNDRVILRVGGMTCAMCVKAIENALMKLDGVRKATVNPSVKLAYVTYNSQVTSVEDMKDAIRSAGYQYIGTEGEDTEDLEKEIFEKNLKEKEIRIIIGFGISLPLMALMLFHVSLPVPMPYFMLAVTILPFLFLAYPIFLDAWRALRNRTLNMDVMYSMGIGVAYFSSILGTFNIVLTSEFLFYETALMLAAFLTLGRYLEAKAKGRTTEAIRKLIGLRPKTATLIRNGKEVEIPITDVRTGDSVLIKPGGKIPVDGDVLSGESYVDESMISGEPVPVFKHEGDSVIGGTLNKNGVLTVLSKKVGKDTLLSEIIRLVEDAQGSKPPVQRIADTAVSYFIPVVLLIAVIAFLTWYLLPGNTLLFSLNVFISILVVACPCALGLATPTAITVGIGRGAELGILIKNGETLEISEKITTVVFDKTGTLTVGTPVVTDISTYGVEENFLLRISSGLEKNSSHPLAEAIVARAAMAGIEPGDVIHFNTIGGKGVEAISDGKKVIVGNRALMDDSGILIPVSVSSDIEMRENEGKTAMIVAWDGSVAGVISVADTLREDAKAALTALRAMGPEIVMITGDNEKTARAIGSQVGISNIIAGVRPAGKEHEVAKLQESGEIVAFIGDGINDAPAIVRSDVGIAIGSGTDIAIESGDIVLINNNLLDAVGAVQLSKKVMGRIRLNIFWAFAYNAALIPVAAGLLYPVWGITFRPELAGLAMALSSVTVVSLSLLLKRYVPPVRIERVVREEV